MSKYLVDVTMTQACDTIEEAKRWEQELRADNHFEVKEFSAKNKQVKTIQKDANGRKLAVIAEYILAKAKLHFNDEKMPKDYIEVSFKNERELTGNNEGVQPNITSEV